MGGALFGLLSWRLMRCVGALTLLAACSDHDINLENRHSPSQVPYPNENSHRLDEVSRPRLDPENNLDPEFGRAGAGRWGNSETLDGGDYRSEFDPAVAAEFLSGRRRAFPHTMGCRPRNLDKVLSQLHSPADQSRFLQQYFETCSEDLAQTVVPIESVRGLESHTLYPFWQDPRFQLYRFTMPDRIQVRGLLALKDQNRRPLVVVKLGTLSDLNHPANALYLSHFFDASPFHVLVLESTTSAHAILDNRELVLGGVIEGIHIYRVGQFLLSHDFRYSSLFSEVHLLGLSLGGHAVLYAGLYSAEQFRTQGVADPFRSVMAMCPAVDFKHSVQAVFDQGPWWKKQMTQFFFVRWMKKLFSLDPFIRDHVFEDKVPGEDVSIVEGISQASTRFYQGWSKLGLGLAPLHEIHIEDVEDFWSVNDFAPLSNHLRRPAFAWHAVDDDVVPVEHGGGRLQQAHLQSETGVLITNTGKHCRFSYQYGWDVESKVLRNVVMSQSHQAYTVTPRSIRLEIPTEITHAPGRLVNIFWRVPHTNWNLAELVFRKEQREARWIGRDRVVITEHVMTFDRSQFYDEVMDPQNGLASMQLTRWLAANVHITESSRDEDKGLQGPLTLEWQELSFE